MPSSLRPLRHPLQTVARVFLAVWLAPTMGSVLGSAALLGAPGKAQAQAAPEPVVVLDFSIPNGVDPLIGRKVADALAVELQKTGNFDVKTRQEVEAAVATTPGLRPPFNEATQQALARAVNSTSVFSGRVTSVDVSEGRSARVRIDVRQLDASTGDYINGAPISEVSSERLQQLDNEVLVDEAINKAAISAVRSLRQTVLPTGNVLNVTSNDVEVNIGFNKGGASGQRYSVLRDTFNKARGAVERNKIGEVTLTRVDADQATAVLSAGGQAGLQTGDRIRRIYEFTNLLAYTSATGGSVTPVTAPPERASGTPRNIKKFGNGVIGLIALAALVSFAGFGGGGNSSGGTAQALSAGPPGLRGDYNAGGTTLPQIEVRYRANVNGISSSGDIQGFLIYRGTQPNFASTPETLQEVVVGDRTRFSDLSTVSQPVGRVTFTEDNTGVVNGTPGRIIVNQSDGAGTTAGSIVESTGNITINFLRTPVVPDTQYFYSIQTITAFRQTSGASTRVDLNPISQTSRATGGATALVPPRVLPSATATPDPVATATPAAGPISTGTGTDLDNFSVVIDGDPGDTELDGFVYDLADQFKIQVSTSNSFPIDRTLTQVVPKPTRDAGNTLTFNLGDINVPGFTSGDFDRVFVRVGVANSADQQGNRFIFGQSLQIISPGGGTSVAQRSRFVRSANGSSQRRGPGYSLPGSGGLTRAGRRRTPPTVFRP